MFRAKALPTFLTFNLLVVLHAFLNYFIVTCRTTENTRSVSADSDIASQKTRTLLHPYEEAERTRATNKHIKVY